MPRKREKEIKHNKSPAVFFFIWDEVNLIWQRHTRHSKKQNFLSLFSLIFWDALFQVLKVDSVRLVVCCHCRRQVLFFLIPPNSTKKIRTHPQHKQIHALNSHLLLNKSITKRFIKFECRGGDDFINSHRCKGKCDLRPNSIFSAQFFYTAFIFRSFGTRRDGPTVI
jgi:hypothetical protein